MVDESVDCDNGRMTTPSPNLFKGRHFDREIIVLCVRWYLSFKLSARDLVQMMNERGIGLATQRFWAGLHEDVELSPLNTAEEVRAMLAKLVQDVRNRRVDPRVATSLSQLATTLLKAIEVADIEKRLSTLEGVKNGPEKTN